MTDGSGRAPCGRARCRLSTLATAALLPGFLAACASGGSGPARATQAATVLPTRTAFDAGDFTNQPSSVRDTVLSEPRARIWAALPWVFGTLGVETSTFDDRSYAIGNVEWRPSAIHGTRLSSFLQCGSGIGGPNADNNEVTMQLLVQLEERAASSTLVRILIDAYARPRDAAGDPVHCSSFGTLEGRVVRLIGEAPSGVGEGGYPLAVYGAGPASATSAPTGVPSGRLPSLDEFVRVGCVAAAEQARLAEGAFKGVSSGALMLELGSPSRSVAVPVTSVSSIQIREERSRTRIGALIGALLGGAGGAYRGRSLYDPEAQHHFPRGAATTIGGVIGAIAGAAIGAIGGSLLDHQVWLDATPQWQARFQAAAPAPRADALPATSTPCPGFDLDG